MKITFSKAPPNANIKERVLIFLSHAAWLIAKTLSIPGALFNIASSFAHVLAWQRYLTGLQEGEILAALKQEGAMLAALKAGEGANAEEDTQDQYAPTPLTEALEVISDEFGCFLFIGRMGDNDPHQPDEKREWARLVQGDDPELIDVVEKWLAEADFDERS